MTTPKIKPFRAKIEKIEPFKRDNVVFAWRWTCKSPEHESWRRRMAYGHNATYDLAHQKLTDHLIRYHQEVHRCRHCNAPRDLLLLQMSAVYPRPAVSYRCTNCQKYTQVQMGPSTLKPSTEWPPGSGSYPYRPQQ